MNFFVKFFFLFISIAIPFSNYPEKISDYNIFIGDPHNLKTTTEFTPYDLITPLFTDYALKHRTIFIPKDKKINYHKIEAFDFPIGSIITKTFYYPYNFNDLSKGISLKETRILIHEADGWVGLPYIWNEDETEAFLEITGGIKKTRWIDSNGQERSINYIIPNMNQCKGCHAQDGITLPIGPKARHINHNYNYGDEIINQLTKWKELGYFEVLPNIEDALTVPSALGVFGQSQCGKSYLVSELTGGKQLKVLIPGVEDKGFQDFNQLNAEMESTAVVTRFTSKASGDSIPEKSVKVKFLSPTEIMWSFTWGFYSELKFASGFEMEDERKDNIRKEILSDDNSSKFISDCIHSPP